MRTEERIGLAARLWAEGLSMAEVAARLGGVTRGSVSGMMDRNRARFPLRGRSRSRGGQRPGPMKTRAEQPERRRDNGCRAAEGKTKGSVAKTVVAPRPAPPPQLPATLPIRFADAVEHGRCLHFIGDPLGRDGPDMPVCGGTRAAEPVRGRYCPYHARSQFRAVPA